MSLLKPREVLTREHKQLRAALEHSTYQLALYTYDPATAEIVRLHRELLERVRLAPFRCPTCDGSHFGRDTGTINGVVRALDTVRCHAPKCGWAGKWP